MENLIKRLRRIRTVICPNLKYEDEVERCPCVRGGRDAASENGGETGCKDLLDAIHELEDEPREEVSQDTQDTVQKRLFDDE